MRMRKKKGIALFLAACMLGGMFSPMHTVVKAETKAAQTNIMIEAEEGREKLNFNQGWKFIRRNIPEAIEVDYSMDELERWENVDLPHTVREEAYINSGGENYQGPAMYRKHFYLPESYQGKKLYIEFEAVMGVTDVWVNGQHLQGQMAAKTGDNTQYGGYLSFVLDITEAVHCDGQTNVITVLTDNSDNTTVPPGKPQGQLDFTYFGGIYRSVWLHAMNSVHITDAVYEDVVGGGGILVDYPEVTKEQATVDVKTHIRNEKTDVQEIVLKSEIKDKEGNVVADAEGAASVEAGDAVTVEQTLNVENPNLWNLDNPYMHTLVSRVLIDGQEVDCKETAIGIRKITMDPENGVMINGEHPGFLSGVNRHQEYPYIGFAASASLQRRDAIKYKSAGFNIVRTAHHPQSNDFLKACDELGILVMESIPGWQHWSSAPEFAARVKNDTRQMIRRDRNHPCIFTFEISLNESPGVPSGFTNEVESIAKEEHPSLKTSAENPHVGAVADVLYGTPSEVASWSDSALSLIREYGDFWEEQFGRFGDDCRVTRGEGTFYPGGEARMVSQANNRLWKGYTFEGTGSISLSEGIQNYLDSNHRFAAVTMWIGIDHNRGYHSTMSPCGIWDLRRIPKYSYYAFESQRSTEKNAYLESQDVLTGPMLFIASSWSEKAPVIDKSSETFGTDEKRIIYIYSNSDKVKLSVISKDGEVLWEETHDPITEGTAPNLEHPPFQFDDVPYTQDSYLKAEGYDAAGTKLIEKEQHTAGEPAQIQLEVDDSGANLVADGSDKVMVYATILDKDGNVCQTADNELEFSVEGEGTIVSDGDKRVGANPVAAEAGVAAIYINATKQNGDITIKAESDGLTAAETTIVSEEFTQKSVPYEEIAQGVPMDQMSMYLLEKEKVVLGNDPPAITEGTVAIHGTDYVNSMQVKNMAPVEFQLEGAYKRLTGKAAVSDASQVKEGVIFRVYADGSLIYKSEPVTDQVIDIDVDVSGAEVITLCAGDAKDGNTVVPCWLSPYVTEGKVQPDESELRENLALQKSVTATSVDAGTTAEAAVDGDILTLWRSAQKVTEEAPQEFVVDLGKNMNIRNAKLAVEFDYLKCTYTIYTSEDNETWMEQITSSKTAHGNDVVDEFTAENVRYVKVKFTSVESTQGESGGSLPKASIKELEIYADKGIETVRDYHLSVLSIAGKDVVFHENKTEYEIEAEGFEQSFWMKACPANEESTIKINGKTYSSNMEYVETEPNEDNEIVVEVTSPNGKATKQYVVSVKEGASKDMYPALSCVVPYRNGANSWVYQKMNKSTNEITDFENSSASFIAGEYAWAGDGWLYAGPRYMHPSEAENAVRTFKAPKDGIVILQAEAQKYLQQPGSVSLSVLKNGQKIWPEDADKKVLNPGEKISINFAANVKKDDLLQIVLNSEGSNGGDATFILSQAQYLLETEITKAEITGNPQLRGADNTVLTGQYQLRAWMGDIQVDGAECEWQLKNEVKGVQIDETGLLQAEGSVKDCIVTIQAVRNDVVLAEKEVEIIRENSFYLSDLEWESAVAGYGTVNRDVSSSGLPIRLTDENQNAVTYEKGIGTHAESKIVLDVKEKGYTRFKSYVGIDYSQNPDGYHANVVFKVYFNDESQTPVFDSGEMVYNTPQKEVNLPMDETVEKVILVAEQGENNWSDHADWADAKFLIETSETGEEADKTDLAALIEYAKRQQENAEYQFLVPAVKKAFIAALDKASEVMRDEKATPTEVGTAYDRLLQMVQMLDFTGNNVTLKEMVTKAQEFKEELYTANTWKVFADARTDAQEVIDNPNSLQAEIDEARVALRNAIFQLRLIPDKGQLEGLIKDAEAINTANYTVKSVTAFAAALDNAKSVFADEEATEEDVKTAEAALEEAQKNLVAKGDTEKGSDKEVEKEASKSAAKTGDATQTTAIMIMLMAGVAAVLTIKRKISSGKYFYNVLCLSEEKGMNHYEEKMGCNSNVDSSDYD